MPVWFNLNILDSPYWNQRFVCWMFMGEQLGKGYRMTIPSCDVKKIRNISQSKINSISVSEKPYDSMQDLCNS